MSTKKTKPAAATIEDYGKYLGGWLIARRAPIAERSDDPNVLDPDLYVDMNTGDVVNISDLVDLTEEELAGLSTLFDNDSRCSEICRAIKDKLAEAGYGIFVAGRLVSRPALGVDQLRAAIFAHQDLSRFEPEARKARQIPIISKEKGKSVLAPTASKKTALDLNKAYESNVEKVVALIQGATEADPVSVALVEGVETPAQSTKGIRELKQTELPFVHFTYSEAKGYDVAQLKVLLDRYVGAYRETLEEVPLIEPIEPKKTKNKEKERALSRLSEAGEEELARDLSRLSVTAKKPPTVAPSQPKGSAAVRTIAGAKAPLRAPTAKVAAPAVAQATTRKPVKITSALLTTLRADLVRPKAGQTTSAIKTVASGVSKERVAPDEGPSVRAASKVTTTVSVPLALKGKTAKAPAPPVTKAKAKTQAQKVAEAEEAEEEEEERRDEEEEERIDEGVAEAEDDTASSSSEEEAAAEEEDEELAIPEKPLPPPPAAKKGKKPAAKKPAAKKGAAKKAAPKKKPQAKVEVEDSSSASDEGSEAGEEQDEEISEE
jgi:hypothetical protein